MCWQWDRGTGTGTKQKVTFSESNQVTSGWPQADVWAVGVLAWVLLKINYPFGEHADLNDIIRCATLRAAGHSTRRDAQL